MNGPQYLFKLTWRGGLPPPPLFCSRFVCLTPVRRSVRIASLGCVLVDILHLDHAELDVFMAKLQVRAVCPSPRGIIEAQL